MSWREQEFAHEGDSYYRSLDQTSADSAQGGGSSRLFACSTVMLGSMPIGVWITRRVTQGQKDQWVGIAETCSRLGFHRRSRTAALSLAFPRPFGISTLTRLKHHVRSIIVIPAMGQG